MAWPSTIPGRLRHPRRSGLWQVRQHAAIIESNPNRPEELAATIYHALGVPLNAPQINSGISLPITTGKPVMELSGKAAGRVSVCRYRSISR